MVALNRTVEGLKRAQQVSRTVVPTGDSSARVGDLLAGSVDTSAQVGVQEAQLREIEDKGSADYDVWYETQENEYDNADAAHEAWMEAIAVNEVVDDALDEAAQAAQDAANALATANGKNARRRGVTEPAPPTGGWVQGDQWVRDEDREGVMTPVEVLVWNGSAFVPEQIIANDILVVGPNGVVQIKDDSVTAGSIKAGAIDGKTITGAIIRTAATGQRLQIDGDGLKSYAANGIKTAELRASDGGLDILGSIRSRKNIATEESAVVHPDGFGFSRSTGTPGGGYLVTDTIGIIDGALTVFAGSPDFVTPGYSNTVRLSGQSIDLNANSVKLKGDTNWANFTRATGMNGVAQWRRYLGRIEIYVDYTNEVVGGGHVQLGTLPVAARPRRQQALMASGTNGPTATSYVDAGGVIRFRVAPNTTATAPLVTGSFIQD